MFKNGIDDDGLKEEDANDWRVVMGKMKR